MLRTYFFLLALLLTTSVSMAQNVIVNGDFELWTGTCPTNIAPDGWTNYSTQLGPDEAGTCFGGVTAHGGSSFMNLVWINSGIMEGASQNLQNLTMNAVYRISFWGINSQGIYANPGDCMLEIHRNSTSIFSTPNLVSGGAWTYYSVDFTVTSPFEPIAVRCVGGASGTSGSAGVDDFSVAELVGVEDGLATDVQLYPNPVEDRLHVYVGNSLRGVEGLVQVDVVNLLGQRVLEMNCNLIDGQGAVDVQGLSAGVYYLRIHAEGEEVVRKFMIE
jgi:hypothetical protein